jgi:ubiquinone/menaquinone biosynthesis C-methylase UbiE
MLRLILTIFGWLIVVSLLLHALIRIVRHFYKFPMPDFFANLIDNPLRRLVQPPDQMPLWHGIQPGMKVLEIGPGNGTYTIETAKVLRESGELVTIDIEPRMIQRVHQRAEKEGLNWIDARVADVFDLPFQDGYFDLAYMIAVIGEIPTPERALSEFHRVLTPEGVLAFSEVLPDPDYPSAKRLIQLVQNAGFQLLEHTGNFFSYTVRFQKIDRKSL